MSQTVVKFAKSAIKSQSYQYDLPRPNSSILILYANNSLINYKVKQVFIKCLFCFAIVMKFDMLNTKITLLFVYP